MDPPPKEVVTQAYDQIADWYLSWVQAQRSPRERYTATVLSSLAPTASPRVLELGCGPGVPITRMLLDRGAQVVANDISAKQLDIARAKCPEAEFVGGDMATLEFEAASFGAAVCFYTMFHLPRAEQRGMLSRIYSWLRPGGVFAFNLATVDEEEIHGEFLGYGMFWSSYSVQDSKDMVTDVGFELVEAEELDAGDGQDLEEGDPDYGVKFLWIMARKPT